MSTPTQHARLGASKAHRWMNCMASVHLESGIPDIKTGYAMEGVAAHALAERCLREDVQPHAFIGTVIETIEVTEEMADAVALFVNTVNDVRSTSDKNVGWIEQGFDLAPFNPPERMFGTADAVVWEPDLETLHVFDLKYGSGHPVDVNRNPQLMYYALGAMTTASVPARRIRCVIVQPRMMHPDGQVREVTYDVVEVASFAGTLMAKARQAVKDPGEPVAGPWCQFCKATAVCPARMKLAQQYAQVAFDEPVLSPPMPETLTQKQLQAIITHADLIEDWIRDVRAYVTNKLNAGEKFPGFKLVQKRAQRKWISEEATMLWLRNAGYDDTEYLKMELKSPAQIEKVIGKKNSIPEDLVVKESSGVSLVRETDPRPAVVAAQVEFDALSPSEG